MSEELQINDDRPEIFQGGEVLDVTSALSLIPAMHWSVPQGDAMIANLDAVGPVRLRDILNARIQRLGDAEVRIASAYA